MALSTAVGALTVPGSTGNQAVSSLNFQPKAVIFFGTSAEAVGSAADASFSIGWATSSTARRVWCYGSRNNQGTTDPVRRTEDLCTSIRMSSLNSVKADFVSMDSNGFTINWTQILGSPAGAKIVWIALGGSDITDVVAHNFAAPATIGESNQNVGFQPDLALFQNGLQVYIGDGTDGHGSFGAMDAAGDVGAIGIEETVSGTSNCVTRDGAATNIQTTSAGRAAYITATTASPRFDSDGFNISWITTDPVEILVSALCFKGPLVQVGVETQKTSTGTKSTTTSGITPKVLMLFSRGSTNSSGAIEADVRISLGVATGSGTDNQFSIWTGALDNQATSNCSSDFDNTKAIKFMTANGASPTLLATAALSSMDSEGFTLDWTTADATARRFYYIVLGEAPAAAPALRLLAATGVGK